MLRAIDFADRDGEIVGSALALAAAARAALESGPAGPRLDFAGFQGGSSSYFTVVIRRLLEHPDGPAFVRDDSRFTFGSPFQRSIFERSREAVLSGN